MYQNNGYQNGSYPSQQGYQQQGGYAQPQTAPAQGNALDWDDDFTAEESTRSPLLTEGDYWFEIAKLERGRHNGSDKIPACNKATITFKILAPQGEAIITENFFVVDLDWARRKNTSLFASIGIAKKGEPRVKPVWSNEIAGRRGVCHIAPRSYTKDGQEYKTNDLKYLYPMWDQPNVEPVAPTQGYSLPQYQHTCAPAQGYAPQPQGYQPAPAQGYQPQGGYQPSQNNGGYGGGVY